LKVNSLYDCSFNVALLGGKLERLDAMGLDTPKTNKITEKLVNIATISTVTLRGAEMLNASATCHTGGAQRGCQRYG
jgi:hypothetical protein